MSARRDPDSDVVGPAEHLDRDDAVVGGAGDCAVSDEPLYALF